jgi:hypothetical protein
MPDTSTFQSFKALVRHEGRIETATVVGITRGYRESVFILEDDRGARTTASTTLRDTPRNRTLLAQLDQLDEPRDKRELAVQSDLRMQLDVAFANNEEE